MDNKATADPVEDMAKEQQTVVQGSADALAYQAINKVRTSNRPNPATGELRTIVRFELGDGSQVFLSNKQIFAATGIERGFDVLKGSKLAVSFYKQGEELISGAHCTKDNVIVKEFEFELTNHLTNIKTAAAFGMGLFGNQN